jgi:hypothetical protein
MNSAIESAIEAYRGAADKLRRTMKAEQKKCKHGQVIHSPWRASEWGPAFKARRLCLDCGLEEEAKHSGWGDNDSDFAKLKTKGFHKVVCSDELYRSRFPEGEVDCANEG